MSRLYLYPTDKIQIKITPRHLFLTIERTEFIYHFCCLLFPMSPRLTRLIRGMDPINTMSAFFFIIYFLMMGSTWSTLNWGGLDILLPLLAVIAIYSLGWGSFYYRRKKNNDIAVNGIVVERKRLIKYLLNIVPLIIIYQNMSFFGQSGHADLWDATMYRADEWLVGEIPALWAQNIYSDLLSEIMSISYFIYFAAPLTYMLLYWKKEFPLFRKYIFSTLFMHYIALMFFIAIPVTGPKYYYEDMFAKDVGGWTFTHFNSWIYEFARSNTTDCFPSMHVGLFLLITYYMYRYDRRSLFITIPVTLLMSASTLYLGYHYLIDIVAAVILVIITLLFTHYYFKWWKRSGRSAL